jgi:hypothetical protein
MIALSIWIVKTPLAAEEFHFRDGYDWDERKSNH